MRPRVYLAARYTRRLELVKYAAQLSDHGFTITSRWLLGTHQWEVATPSALGPEDRDPAYAEDPDGLGVTIPPEAVRFALDDWEDVQSADVVVSFTERPRTQSTSRGGRHVEFGMALGLEKRLIVVGWRENVFHLLPDVEFYRTWGEARDALIFAPVVVDRGIDVPVRGSVQ